MHELPQELLSIVHALEAGLSPNESERSAALEQLQSWSSLGGFFSGLLRIATVEDVQLGHNGRTVRLQAILQFKNGIDRNWRKTSSHCIQPDEKASIRELLLSSSARGDLPIAKTLALSIAKIARIDLGTDWNSLPNELLVKLQQAAATQDASSSAQLSEALLRVLYTTKALAANRMPKGRAVMASFRQVFSSTLLALLENLQQTTLSGQASGENAIQCIDVLLLVFRTLIAFITSAGQSLHEEPLARFFANAADNVSSLYRWAQNSREPRVTELSDRLLLKHVKLFRLVASEQKEAYASEPLAGRIRSFALQVVQDAAVRPDEIVHESTSTIPSERLVVQSILALQKTLGDWSHGPLASVPADLVPNLANILVTRLLPFRETDVEAFFSDPEEWVKDADAERQEFDLRPAVEHALLAIFAQYSDDLRPALLALIQSQSSVSDTSSREAMLTAIGLSAEQIRESFDFGAWFTQELRPALERDTTPELVKMRIVWLLGRFAAHDLPAGTHGQVYTVLAAMLAKAPSRALGTRLTAVKSLIKCDSWDLDEVAFASALPTIVDNLIVLMGETELPDSHLSLNQLFSIIIDRFGPQLVGVSARLIETLVAFWNNNSDPHFQASLLSTITKAVEINPDVTAAGLTAACWSLVSTSINRAHPAFVYLHEDAVELWLALVKQSTRLDEPLANLLLQLPELIGDATDTLQRVLRICESYLLLDAAAVLQAIGGPLVQAFTVIAFDVKIDVLRRILGTADLALRLAPADLCLPHFETTGMLQRLLQSAQSSDSALVSSRYLITLARMALSDSSMFTRALWQVDQGVGSPGGASAQMLIQQWTDKFDNIAESSSRKLIALASASLCASCLDVWQAAGSLAFIWSSALAQTEEEDNGDAEVYRHDDYDPESDINETNETQRRKQATATDVVHCVRLRDAVANAVMAAQRLALEETGQSLQSQCIDGRVDTSLWDELDKRLFQGLAG